MNRRFLILAAALASLLAGCRPVRPASPAPPSSTPASTPSRSALAGTPAVATRVVVPVTPPATPRPLPAVVSASPSPDTGAGTPAAGEGVLLEAMDAIGGEMEMVRGLDATQPVSRTVIGREELSAYLRAEFERDYTPEEAQAEARALAAFDLVPEDYDLRQALLDVYGEQVLGFYDDETRALYVVSDTGLDLLARITLAHEYTHGLQDEHFDLQSFIDEDRLNDDQVLARLALVEGDASLAMTHYLLAHLSEVTAKDVAALLQEAEGQGALEKAPPIIRETLTFPYLEGQTFVTTLQETGWAAVDDAYANPPASTEQILHPEKYLAGDEPQLVSVPSLTGTLGAGWRLAETETLGEFQMRVWLDQQLETDTAEQASAGWGGDRYSVHVRGADEVLLLRTAWDSAADREQFAAAYRAYAEASYGQPGSQDGSSPGQGRVWWETLARTACLAWEETTAVVVLGPDRATVERVLAAGGP